MLCKKCGAFVVDGLKYCQNCGASMEEDTLAQPENNSFGVENVNNTNGQPINNVQPYVNEITSQPVNNVPPVVPMNSGDSNNNYSSEKKDRNGLILVIVLIVLALLACGGIVYWSTKKNNPPDNNSNVTSNTESNSNVTSNINSNITIYSNTTSNILSNTMSNITSNIVTSNVTSNVVTSNVTSNVATTNANYYATKFAGYVLQIPKTYAVVSASASQLQLMGTNAKDVAIISIKDGQYDTIKGNLSQLNAYVKQKGYTLNKNATVKNYNGVEFITVEISQSGQSMVLSYSKLSATKVVMIVFGTTSSQVDYSKFNTFAYTVKTAKVG